MAVAVFARIVRETVAQWDASSYGGFLQRCAAPVKILFVMWILAMIGFKHTLAAQAGVAFLLFGLSIASGRVLSQVYKRASVVAFLFGILVPLPAILFGLQASAPLLFMRTFNSATAAFLLMFTTPFPKMLRGLSALGLPSAFALTMSLTRQWGINFSRVACDMAMAKQSRDLVLVSPGRVRVWTAGRLAVLYERSRVRYEEILRAMNSRAPAGRLPTIAAGDTAKAWSWRSAVLAAAAVAAGIL